MHLISPHLEIHNQNVKNNKIARLVMMLTTITVALSAPVVTAHANTTGSVPTITSFPKPGTLVARVYIPRLRDRVWGKKVVEDTTLTQLAQGFGHYQGTAMPGRVGNFAIAAHRRGPMSPLYDINRLRQGDRVIIHRGNKWFYYKLTTSMIVLPSAIWVISPQPRNVVKIGSTPRPIITLQTCTPAATSTHRWIWWGVLSKVVTSNTIPTLR